MDSPADPPAKRGRPRSPEADRAILDATLQLAGEVGIHGLSMDELARRANVSKATIYRRWCSKEALVLEALSAAMRPLDDVDTGHLRSDLHHYLTELVNRLATGRTSDILPHLISVADHDEALRSSLDEYVEHRRKPLGRILHRAAERGELPPDTDIDTMLDTIIGPFFYRRLLNREQLDDHFITCLLNTIAPDR